MQALALQLQRPVVRASLTSGSVMAIADVVCQRIQQQQPKDQWQIDTKRALRFGLVGLTLHGPFFLYGFNTLDKIYGPSKSFGAAMRKVWTGQFTLFPTYVVSFFMYMSLLEGRGVEGGIHKIQTSFTNTFMTGSVFWPLVNTFNFMYVPSTRRVLYINACGLVWNAFLSWINSKGSALKSAEL